MNYRYSSAAAFTLSARAFGDPSQSYLNHLVRRAIAHLAPFYRQCQHRSPDRNVALAASNLTSSTRATERRTLACFVMVSRRGRPCSARVRGVGSDGKDPACSVHTAQQGLIRGVWWADFLCARPRRRWDSQDSGRQLVARRSALAQIGAIPRLALAS
jgi:hypothetical protein